MTSLHHTVQRLLRRKHGIEVAHVNGAGDARLERWLYLLPQKLVEVEVLREEGMFLDVISAVYTETVVGITCEKAGEDGACG